MRELDQIAELQAKIEASRNQLNALKSTGPRSEEGKRIASLNAVKTGLTGRTVLLPSDDADAYRAHLAAYETEYRPAGLRETELVQSLADTQWRLQRIPGLEMAIYARGRHEFAEAHSEHPLPLRTSLIELDIHLKYEKQLRNLQLQESRLHRRFDKEMAELRQLQKDHQAKAASESRTSASVAVAASGFVFSNPVEQPFQAAMPAFQPASSSAPQTNASE